MNRNLSPHQFEEMPQPYPEQEGWDERRMEKRADGQVLAKASYRVHEQGVDIFTMATAPEARRQGHMRSLIDAISSRHGAVGFDSTRTPAGAAFIKKYERG